MTKRIGVLTGGGDCPGLNPAIVGLVHGATHPSREEPVEVLGLLDGWRGLVEYEAGMPIAPVRTEPGKDELIRTLDLRTVDGWDRQGGTELGSSRTNPFNPKNDRSDKVAETIDTLGLDALVCIGGEDTLGVGAKLHQKIGDHVQVIGIPKTIDKDLFGTEYTLGFETAVQVIADEIDRLRTTAGSHRRIFVVETMGRHAGHLALQGGIAGGAFITLIPEHKFSVSRITHLITERKMRGIPYSIIVVAEGAKPEGEEDFIKKGRARDSEFHHEALGGVGEYLALQLSGATGMEVRHVVLSHLQRGGAPVAYDRIIGRAFGGAAMNLIDQGKRGRMVSLRHGKVTSVDITAALHGWHLVDIEKEYDLDRCNAKRIIHNF